MSDREVAREIRRDDVSARRAQSKSARHILWQILPREALMQIRVVDAITPADVELCAAAVMRSDDFRPGLRVLVDLRCGATLSSLGVREIGDSFGTQAQALECDKLALLLDDHVVVEADVYESAALDIVVPIGIFDDPMAALKWLEEADER